jgi:hypothetical protein
VPPNRSSVQSPKSKIQGLLAVLLIAVATSSCGGSDWSEDQQAVHKAMMEWSLAVSREDGNAMWEMLSPDAREIYRRELEGTSPPGIRVQVKLDRAALAPGSRISAELRKEVEARLATMPPDPDHMTAQEYYVWRVTPGFSAEGAENTAGLFGKSNISQIEIDGDRATVILKAGDPDRISWVRHDGLWKFDLKPSTLRALEEAREKEGKTN